ncbi:Uncharacterized protein TCM_027368 [Theobroma cacao]|uniref:Uncharacterized protein n=1 Tax=Theobroma cacao TaxID=3641 RepID=A0A061GG12_THECC|nr:Uncharacterized protein TCM_027368 [Theobroma cacao]
MEEEKQCQKYSDEPSTKPKFDLEAWTKAIGRPNSTQTHIYGFGTKVPTSRLLTPTAMSKFAFGPEAASPLLPPTPKLVGYQQLSFPITDEITIDRIKPLSTKLSTDHSIDILPTE